jgi:hypothetical protein
VKSSGQSRHFLIALLLAVVIYGATYYSMEYQRTRHGPWRLTFSAGGTNSPALLINEPGLHLENLRLDFPGQSAAATNATVVFDQPRDVPFDLPLGKCIFMDAMSLPGTVTLVLFGHEIELLPRTLTIDKKDYPWQSNTNLPVLP